MDYQIGDSVCLSAAPTQHGTVYRLNPLGVQNAVAVVWNAGPTFSQGKKYAYFGNKLSDIEHLI